MSEPMLQKTDDGDRELFLSHNWSVPEGSVCHPQPLLFQAGRNVLREKQVVVNAGIGKICSQNRGVLTLMITCPFKLKRDTLAGAQVRAMSSCYSDVLGV